MTKKTTLQPIIAKIKARMDERGVKQNALADKLNVKENRITLWFQGKGLPNPYQAAEIAEYLGLPLEYLLDDAMTVPPEPGAPTQTLTAAQQSVLATARVVSMDDPDPDQLMTALRRLAITPGSIVAREAASPPDAEPPAGGKARRS